MIEWRVKKLIVCLCCSPCFLMAQTTDEWVKQKQTQKKYLVQQIAALKVYSNYLAEGYQIITTGLNTIQQLKEGDFNLHLDHFLSKIKVNSNIKGYSKVAAIKKQVSVILKTALLFTRFCDSNDHFTKEEKDYLQKVFTRLSEEVSIQLNRLVETLTDNEVSMNDDERINTIDEVYHKMEDSYSFMKSFITTARLLGVQRARANNDLMVMEKLNDLK